MASCKHLESRRCLQAAERVRAKLLKVSEVNEAALHEAQQGVHNSAAAEAQALQESVEEARKRTSARAKMQR